MAFQLLNECGFLNRTSLPLFNPEIALDLYRRMLFIRAFDTRAVNLQRAGKIGNYPSSLGQEAVRAAIAAAMGSEDIVFPTYRDQAVLMQRGLPLAFCFAWWAGDERGNVFSKPYCDFPCTIPIATQCLLGAGAAYAAKMKKEARAIVVLLGDGATSKGDFYEALNIAGVWNLPIVFVICNNQWAISVPLSKQTACKTLAQKAVAGNIEGIQADGNDAIGLYELLVESIELAKTKHIPRVIEAVTYRLSDHTTSDDAKRYRPSEEVEKAWKKEPLIRMRNFLMNEHLLTDTDEEIIKNMIKEQIEEGVREFLSLQPQSATAMMDYLYETIPYPLLDQYEKIRKDL